MMELYVPGHSFLYRLSAKWKFIVLFAVVSLLTFEPKIYLAGAVLLITAILYEVSGLGFVRYLYRMLRRMAIIFLMLFAATWFSYGWQAALMRVASMSLAILLADLLTLTTKPSEIFAVFEALIAPLSVFGISPWKVSLTLSLSLSSIPVVLNGVRRSQEACSARGIVHPGYQILMPSLVRLIFASEAIGDAIIARGLDSDPDLA
ncbi:CbiQ family ECF transporter T component [Silvibacterium sp.]|uniref:CbiQ family ECF transporter T component n=1 Tax=Silvibacterium sp. TaxID=1964179 RepID=UPI0039E71BBB